VIIRRTCIYAIFSAIQTRTAIAQPTARISPADYIVIGENIAMNTYDNPVESAQEALMDSPGHRANILSVEYNNVGVGIASDGETYYFTQLFADLSIPTYKSITTIIFAPAKKCWPDRLETFNEVWNR
jgi:hypothetical protein